MVLSAMLSRPKSPDLTIISRLTYVRLGRMSDSVVVGEMDSHFSVLLEVGVILDEHEGLVLELDDEDTLELSRVHSKSLVSLIGIRLGQSPSSLNSQQASDQNKDSLHGGSQNDRKDVSAEKEANFFLEISREFSCLQQCD